MSFAYDLAVTGGGGGSLLPVFVVVYYSILFLLQHLFLVVLKPMRAPERCICLKQNVRSRAPRRALAL